MQHFSPLSEAYTPRLSGAQAANALTLAFAPGGDDESTALADLFANLGTQTDSTEPRSAAAAELHAALLTTATRLF